MTEYEELATRIWDVFLDDAPHKIDRIMDVVADRCWLKCKEFNPAPIEGYAWRPVKPVKEE